MSYRLDGKVALVTGAGRGIGNGIALELARAGAKVAVADIEENLIREACSRIEAIGGSTIGVQTDVSSSESVDKMVSEAIHEFGQIDILVNNAGVLTADNIIDLKEEQWDKVMNVNLKGTFLCTRAVAKRMVDRGKGGRIVNIASEGAKVPIPGLSSYCASKAGIILFTRCTAHELAPYDITANSICPGYVDSDMMHSLARVEAKELEITEEERLKQYYDVIPLRRFARTEEIGKVVVFLSSEYANYITGEDVNVTGGSSMF